MPKKKNKARYDLIDRTKTKPCPQCAIGDLIIEEAYDEWKGYGFGSMIYFECDTCSHEDRVMYLDGEGHEKIINIELLEFLCQMELPLHS